MGYERRDVLGFRVRAQQFDREHGSLTDTAVLDIGVQDSGPDGGMWALAIRGVDVAAADRSDLVLLWTVRGAPHLYRRPDVGGVAAAVAPWSDADAGKRIFDAARPLKAAGIGNLAALDTVATAMRRIVDRPRTKGDVSTALTQVMDPPYLRFCRPCNATHLYEQPFRLAAIRAGLELQPGTSPPVLQRIKGFRAAGKAPARLDVIREYLRLLGPATPKHVAEYLDAPVAEVKERWPDDAVEVLVGEQKRWLLAEDEAGLGPPSQLTRLLGPFDLFLQARDRDLLVPDAAHARALWPVLGRPGAVLRDGEIAGTWRPRQSAGKLALKVEPWTPFTRATRDAVTEQAERLAAYRSTRLTAVDFG